MVFGPFSERRKCGERIMLGDSRTLLHPESVQCDRPDGHNGEHSALAWNHAAAERVVVAWRRVICGDVR